MWSYNKDKEAVIVSTFIVVFTMIVALIICLPCDIVRQLGTHYICTIDLLKRQWQREFGNSV